jgi:glycosyltransferase involved in cell wall biosynthesis
MTSVVIAAHNEAAVIGRCLDELISQDVGEEPLDITVAANGCTDATAELARQRGVRVVEVEQANKALALNIGDAAARGFPRIYLDADIVVPPGTITAVARTFAATKAAFVAVPRRRMDVTGRPPAVKAYFAINSRLPAFQHGIFGRGLIALSERGRARFQAFPTMVADDLFLDSLFSPTEKISVDSVEVLVATPWHTSDLIRRLVRVRRGNAAMRAAGREGRLPGNVRGADRLGWLQSVVLPHPKLAPAGVIYVLITGVAAVLAMRKPRAGSSWGRDESSRQVRGQSGNSRG